MLSGRLCISVANLQDYFLLTGYLKPCLGIPDPAAHFHIHMSYMHIQVAVARIIIHSHMISQNIRMIGAGLLWHLFKQSAVFSHDPAIYTVCCLLENLRSRSQLFLSHPAPVHLCTHLEYIVTDQRLHLIMPGLPQALFTPIVINITLLKNSGQTTVMELTVV